MLFSKRLKVRKELITNYRVALVKGIETGLTNERSLYEIHLSALNDIENALALSDNVEETAIQISHARRSHGWSYLSGNEGSLASGYFHELATTIENQIFKIKGKDWYYSL